ncbi:hypothetical protein V0U79_10350 [Hyphobacterium sp. HN65]|uniref:DUF2834 domain-containing protein n=1 Tax=Hyphobacterium lacteum TaxID=3116575 RepID=A0ABU7LT07_9PROT|nr:hypothetical protein [Hyphobacterium sp. HN65]MEE2526771.1 hypothetical protein [Hyphobacterium sp. HN65]
MIIWRICIALGGLALGALIALAFADGDFGAAGAWLMADPWGQVTLADLYLGFFFLALVIALFERQPLRAAFWIVPLPFLGNVWAAIWLVLALPELARRLKP